MQDPDPKCRHFGILWHFGIFAKKSNKKSNPIFPILSDFLTFPDFRLSDSTALNDSVMISNHDTVIDKDDLDSITILAMLGTNSINRTFIKSFAKGTYMDHCLSSTTKYQQVSPHTDPVPSCINQYRLLLTQNHHVSTSTAFY